jgi:hypothetical protein
MEPCRSPKTNSSSWPSSSRAPAVSPQRVWDVLQEANVGIGQAVLLLGRVAPRVRVTEQRQALDDDREYLVLIQRSVQAVLRDLAPTAGQAGAEYLERARNAS